MLCINTCDYGFQETTERGSGVEGCEVLLLSARNCLMCGWGRLDMHAVSLVRRVILIIWGGGNDSVLCGCGKRFWYDTGTWVIVGAKGVRVGAG